MSEGYAFQLISYISSLISVLYRFHVVGPLLFGISINVSFFFAGVDIWDRKQDAGFFHITKFRVQAGTKHAHGGG